MQIGVWMLILILFASAAIMAWDANKEERRDNRQREDKVPDGGEADSERVDPVRPDSGSAQRGKSGEDPRRGAGQGD